jgi:hypothetical protein
VAQIETALRTSQVVFVHTQVVHDHIQLVWTPRLLSTAAIPQESTKQEVGCGAAPLLPGSLSDPCG